MAYLVDQFGNRLVDQFGNPLTTDEPLPGSLVTAPAARRRLAPNRRSPRRAGERHRVDPR
jgi:hypothetical protein